MTDKELLELAAKAAGYDGVGLFWHEATNSFWDGEGFTFDPLNDDGDAFRLAVKLGMSISCKLGTASAWTLLTEVSEQYKVDPCAATRRAIVRAAAEIGRTK